MPEPRDMSDRALIEHYQNTNGVPGNFVAAALAREIKRRGLDL